MRFVTGTDPATSRNAAFPATVAIAIVAVCAQASTIAQAPPRPTLQSLAPADLGTTPIGTLMYRAPDGKIEEFLFRRR